MTKTKNSDARSSRTRGWRDVLEPSGAIAIASRVRAAGGRAFVVGGWVRDQLLDLRSKDVDLEIFGMRLDALESALEPLGSTVRVGHSFGVLRVKGCNVDVAVASESAGDTSADAFGAAARRRDLTINSIGWDPLSDELFDPCDGLGDLRSRTLSATDPQMFGADPLRALRVAQLAARLEFRVDAPLLALCREQDLAGVARERVFDELSKLLSKSRRPSLGLTFLREADLLRFLAPLAALVDVAQDPRWHPEGCVWTHTCMVVDRAADLRAGDPARDAMLMWSALCHDLGKAEATRVEADRVSARGHDRMGATLAESWLAELRAPHALQRSVAALVRHHLAPFVFTSGPDPAKAAAYRRLARRLGEAGVDMALLERVARADQLGRTTPEALRGEFAAGDQFLQKVRDLELLHSSPRDVVRGRDVVARGVEPGPALGELLRLCREIQDDRGWSDPDQILDEALERAGS